MVIGSGDLTEAARGLTFGIEELCDEVEKDEFAGEGEEVFGVPWVVWDDKIEGIGDGEGLEPL